MIRPLYLTDLPRALTFLRGVCAELERTFDPETTKQSLLRTMQGGHYMTVYEQDGQIIGMGVLMIVKCFTDGSDTRAIESLWHSNPALPAVKRAKIMMELKADMEAYAEEHGCTLYLCPNMQGKSGKLAQHLEKEGYRMIEAIYHWEATWAI